MAVEYNGFVGWVKPESKVHLMNAVPLDNTYEKTIYPTSLDNQREWFEPYIRHEWDDLTYIRVNANTIRVNLNAERLYTCNYLMFQNTAFSEDVHDDSTWYKHWFYCFVNEVNYVNNNCSEIVFEIDVMQTWHFDYTLGECFIIRQHTTTDNIGDHLIQDISPVGDYVCETYNELLWSNSEYGYSNRSLTDLSVIMEVVDVEEGCRGKIYDGIYGGAELFVYGSGAANQINSKLDEYLQSPDSVTGMYMVPTLLTRNTSSGGTIPQNGTATSLDCSVDAINRGDTINGYEPRNAKLYTYPYCFYGVDNASGVSAIYPYEYFDNLTPSFRVRGAITNPVSVALTPRNFKGQSECYNEAVTLTSYPACSWNADYYKVWGAQNSVPIEANWKNTTNQIAINDVNNVISGIGQAFSTQLNIIGGIGGIIPGAMQTSQEYEVAKTEIDNQVYAASIAADISKGGLNNGCLNAAAGRQAFFGGKYSLLPEILETIDDYWWMYGYKLNKVGVPERQARHYWTYVKLGSVNITHRYVNNEEVGGLPTDAEAKIAQIYKNGITFWGIWEDVKVGDYSQPNGLWGRGAG